LPSRRLTHHEKTFIGVPFCSGCIGPRCKAIWPLQAEKVNDIKSQLGFATKSDLDAFEVRVKLDIESQLGLRIEQAVTSAVTSQALSLLRDTFKDTRDGLLAAPVLSNTATSSQGQGTSQEPNAAASPASALPFRPAPKKEDEEMAEETGKEKRQQDEVASEPSAKRQTTESNE
jgi:hypothetical protein